MGRPRTAPAGGDSERSGEAEGGAVGGPGVTSMSSRNLLASKLAPCLVHSAVPSAG